MLINFLARLNKKFTKILNIFLLHANFFKVKDIFYFDDDLF